MAPWHPSSSTSSNSLEKLSKHSLVLSPTSVNRPQRLSRLHEPHLSSSRVDSATSFLLCFSSSPRPSPISSASFSTRESSQSDSLHPGPMCEDTPLFCFCFLIGSKTEASWQGVKAKQGQGETRSRDQCRARLTAHDGEITLSTSQRKANNCGSPDNPKTLLSARREHSKNIPACLDSFTFLQVTLHCSIDSSWESPCKDKQVIPEDPVFLLAA